MRRSTARGLAAGLVAGAAASWVMERYQAAAGKMREQWKECDAGGEPQRAPEQASSEDEAANVKLAVAVSQKVFQHRLDEQEKPKAAEAVHYAYGTILGGLYGVAAEHSSTPRWGGGALFGAALWLLSDEIMVPALKLSKGPGEYSAPVHLNALASHLVYGIATETVRRALR